MASERAGYETTRRLRRVLAREPRRALVGLALLSASFGCGDERTTAIELHDELEDHEELPPGRHAQIHVVGALDDTGRSDPSISAAARFAVFHGMDDTFARSRISLSAPALNRLAIDTCARSGFGDELPREGRAGPLAWRDLSLIDAGQVDLHFAGERITLDYALAPDLINWMSGVEYRRYVDALPLGAFDRRAPTPLHLSVAGAAEEELPPFGLGASLPVPVDELRLDLDSDAQTLELSWSSEHSGRWPLLVRVHRGDASLECVLADDGHFPLDASILDAAGLLDSTRPLASGEGVELEISRYDHLNVAAGVFEEIDVILETQLTTQLELREFESED